jgi:L-alanine-DL-glutamate epimerase-like enolase superfamily enzyme
MRSPLQLSLHIEDWATKIPFRITGRRVDSFKVIVVVVSDGTHEGRGEGFPVFYLGETAENLEKQIEACAAQITRYIDRKALLGLMPRGAARNAVDCALWDFEAKSGGRTVWELTGITPKSVTTAFTIGIEDTAEAMAQRATEASSFPILKIKVDDDRPVERIAAIRAARPDARLTVDANQAWTFEQLVAVAPGLKELDVKLIEQPLRRGEDRVLEQYQSPIPLCADESCQDRSELDQAARRYQIINIKLDKAGGLTEALLLAESVRERGLELLVSNMGGTSLSMAPAFVLAQLCQYVELDGHLLLKHDNFPSMSCYEGEIATPSPQLWG